MKFSTLVQTVGLLQRAKFGSDRSTPAPKFAVFRPAWPTVYTRKAENWHGSVHHARQFRGGVGVAVHPVGLGTVWRCLRFLVKNKCKGFQYSLPSIGPGAEPDAQAVSPQMTIT